MRIIFSKPSRIFFISLLAAITFVLLTSLVVSLFYEQTVVRFLKKYLDEHLVTQVSMDDFHFRILAGFPNGTVEIDRAVVLSGRDFSTRDFGTSVGDTLLKARKVSFQFDLIGLFKKDYELKKIEITGGYLNVLYDRKGRHNFTIWKRGDPGDPAANHSVNLSSISLSDIHFRWIDLKNQIRIETYTERSAFRGTYANSLLSGETRANLSGTDLLIRDKVWLSKADLQVQLKMLHTSDRIRVRQGRVKLNRADIALKGDLGLGKDRMIDMSFSIPRFGLAEVMSLVPFRQDNLTGQYRFAGNGSLDISLKGSLSNPDRLQINSQFNLSDCSARHLKTKAVMDNIHASGNISGTRADNFRLNLDDFSAGFGKGNFHGNLQITDLHKLRIRAKITSDIDLDALQDFLVLNSVENMEGMILADFEAEGSLGRIRADSLVQLLEVVKKGNLDFRNAGISLKRPEWSLQHITGKVILDHIIRLDSLSVTLNDNALRLNGSVQNLYRYLAGKDDLRSDLTVDADHFSLNGYLQNRPGRSSGRGGYRTFFPRRMHMTARIHAGVFDALKFRAEDLDLTCTMMGDSIYIPFFSMAFPDGRISGNALVSQNRDPVLAVNCNAVSKQVDIQQLFTSFNNFSQHFILDKNVKGKLDGNISFFVQWDSTLHYLSESLKAKADIEITNGELVQFEPMLKLSKYINVDELQLIRFRTMKNEIFISDRLVTIPEMDIHTSAFNINVSGQHTFSNHFDYRMRVLLSEVLFNKARKKRIEMDEFQREEQQDEATIPLIIAGTPQNFDVKFDRRRAFDLTRKNMTQDHAPAPDVGNFRIEWEESAVKPEQIERPVTGKDQDDFTIEWDDEGDTENKNL